MHSFMGLMYALNNEYPWYEINTFWRVTNRLFTNVNKLNVSLWIQNNNKQVLPVDKNIFIHIFYSVFKTLPESFYNV